VLDDELGGVLDEELGGVSDEGGVCCAITSAAGAMEINAANKSVRRGLMNPLPEIEVDAA
jgi:hypothetical protein